MTTIEGLPLLLLADWVPGPKQGAWTYHDYAALQDGQRYEIVNGVLLILPSQIVPGMATPVEDFFASVW